MPQVSKDEVNSQYWEPLTSGPIAQCDISSSSALLGGPPATIAASGNFTSNLIQSDGFKVLSVGVQLSVTGGSLVINRFLDKSGQVPVTGATATALTTSPGVYTLNDGAPFQSFKVVITAPASLVNVSNFVLLLNAN